MEIVRQGRDTMLVAGVPQRRGAPVHFEHDDETAVTNFDTKSGKVMEIHTPRNLTVIRIHELMHARHTTNKRYNKAYRGVEDIVGQITEDVRIHVKHWPWRRHDTPQSIREAVASYMQTELSKAETRIANDPSNAGNWADFATRVRAAAVLGGMMHDFGDGTFDSVGFATEEQKNLARIVINDCLTDDEERAAMRMATVFDKVIKKPMSNGDKPPFRIAGGAGDGFATEFDVPIITVNGYAQPEMEVIELDKTEHCEGAGIGTRRATMGSRMYRPALRRPLLPQRLFLRRTPVEPGGTILIDASGSMGDFNEIASWAEKAPFGTIAYYAGDGGKGWLWIYARDGRRAKEVEHPPSRGNTVDGPALTWLMMQDAPRTFVTDRGFCDATDSEEQKARLRELERTNQVTVVNYNTDGDA